MVRLLLAVFVVALFAEAATAQPLFGNPFSDAGAYRNERGALGEARYRVRYEATRVAGDGAQAVNELVLDVADDWALAREADRVQLYDFRLNRIFTLNGGDFTSNNGLGALVFRIMERQNRSYLQRILAAAGAGGQLPDACDAESELSLVIPGATDAGVTEWREQRGVFTLRCNSRDIGSYSAGDGAAPPPAFWPTIYSEMPTHPALHRRVREDGRAPAQMSNTFRDGANALSQRAWRLIAVETVSTPYPLEVNLRNTTADALNQIVPDAGRIGAEAVAGRAFGGAPTLQTWDAQLRDISRNEGEAAAAMLVGVSLNMFPELQCNSSDRQHAVCEIATRLRSIRDPTPMTMLEISIAEQSRNNAAVIAAMTRAQSSPLRDHPALGAAYALALPRFNDAERRQATAANLPLDMATLQNRALLAYPYNPAYWTDVGDRYGGNYEWPSAFMFFDVAYSLPMPSSLSRNQALMAKRTQMERIRRDFPDAFLPTRP